MRHQSPSSPIRIVLLLVLTGAVLLLVLPAQSAQPRLSRWMGVLADDPDSPGQISGVARAVTGDAVPVAPGTVALERYNQGSTLQESVADGGVRFYRRDLSGGGSIAYFVVRLDPRVHLEVLNANGATPGSDATGDTIWIDGGRHLVRVADMVRAPYAEREAMTLLGAMAFGFHGAVRTSNEGSVVINGTVHRVNPWRSTLCITPDQRARIGLFDAETIQQCEQAIGGGPVILWRGKIANPDVTEETSEFLPFNPLDENFTQLDWRKKIYTGLYPKTVIGIGTRADGGSYLVMLISRGVTGIQIAQQLREMGCIDAIGGDDDTSTQAVWRGESVFPHQVRAVPDALAVYVRQ